MKYSISREQQFFFEQNHFIEFDELLSAAEQKSLFEALKKQGSNIRDLTHISEAVKTVTHMSRLAKLASELTRVRHLRFGFDQLLYPPVSIANLQSDVCIQGQVLALYICLDGEKAGHALFAAPTKDLALLPLDPDRKYFLIVWAEEKAMYLLQPKDPHTHQLKKHGYVFGDRLKEEWHPTLIR